MYHKARNTIYRIIQDYPELSANKLVDIKKQYENGDLSIIELDSIFSKHRKGKVRKEDEVAIEKCCKEYFNCELDPVSYCYKLCEEKHVSYYYVKNYDPDNIETDYNVDRAKITRSIRNIRNTTHPKKNHSEVYGFYQQTKRYKENPISYDTFYKYAAKHWQDIDWGCSLGEYIDSIEGDE